MIDFRSCPNYYFFCGGRHYWFDGAFESVAVISGGRCSGMWRKKGSVDQRQRDMDRWFYMVEFPLKK